MNKTQRDSITRARKSFECRGEKWAIEKVAMELARARFEAARFAHKPIVGRRWMIVVRAWETASVLIEN